MAPCPTGAPDQIKNAHCSNTLKHLGALPRATRAPRARSIADMSRPAANTPNGNAGTHFERKQYPTPLQVLEVRQNNPTRAKLTACVNLATTRDTAVLSKQLAGCAHAARTGRAILAMQHKSHMSLAGYVL